MLGFAWTKRNVYSSLNNNNILRTLERNGLPQSSDNIHKNSCGAISCLMILKESTPEKIELILQLKSENYRTLFCHQLNVLLSRYRNNFFVANDFDKNNYYQSLWNIHFSCEANVHDKYNFCKNNTIDAYTFEKNPLLDEDTCCCQSILPFSVKCLKNEVIPNKKKRLA